MSKITLPKITLNGNNCKFFYEKMTNKEFFLNLTLSEAFRQSIIDLFINSKFDNIYWEFPVYGKNFINNNAEFVFIRTNKFDSPNSTQFESYFHKHDSLDNCTQTINFPNLSGDTQLIIPCKKTNNYQYCGHIMNFMKNGDDVQKHNLLQHIGLLMRENEMKDKVFLSTHGDAIPWLHIRICSYSKYYTYDHYKNDNYKN